MPATNPVSVWLLAGKAIQLTRVMCTAHRPLKEKASGQYNYWLDLGDCGGSGGQSSVASSSPGSVAASSRAKSSVATGSCTSPAYVNGSSYQDGALVRNLGNEYRCTVGGWCTVGGPYEPGVGWAWANAWALVRSCQ